MHKKLMMACMAIAAFAAFVIAPAASAAKLTENGVLVPVHPAGKTCGEDPTGCFIATNTVIFKFTSSINVECSTAHLTGIVTKNEGGEVKGEVTNPTFNGTGTGGDCTGAGSVTFSVNKLCLDVASDVLRFTGCGGSIFFTAKFTDLGNLTCKYSITSLNATLITNTSPVPATVTEAPILKAEGGVLCPSEGKLDMTFDLYTDNLPTETPLTISP